MYYSNILDINFANFVPVFLVDIGALILVIVVILGVTRQLIRWHSASIPKELIQRIAKLRMSTVIGTALRSIGGDSIAVKPLYSKSRLRWLTHATIMWGFVGLALTTTLAYIFNPEGTSMPFSWPVRILGNTSGALVLIGCSIFFFRLVTDPNERNAFTIRADLTFFVTLYLATISGVLTEFYGYGDSQTGAYAVYVVHLTLIVILLALAPFTRFLHAIMTPYFAIIERLRARIPGNGRDPKFKDRRMARYVIDSFYSKEEDKSSKVD